MAKKSSKSAGGRSAGKKTPKPPKLSKKGVRAGK